VRAGEPLPCAQFGEHGLHVLEGAAHPFQFGVRELFPDERRAHLVIGEDGAVVALGQFIQFDRVVLDGRGFELPALVGPRPKRVRLPGCPQSIPRPRHYGMSLTASN